MMDRTSERPQTVAEYRDQTRKMQRRERARRANAAADRALRIALEAAFPGQTIDQNRLDGVTSMLTVNGHDVKPIRR